MNTDHVKARSKSPKMKCIYDFMDSPLVIWVRFFLLFRFNLSRSAFHSMLIKLISFLGQEFACKRKQAQLRPISERPILLSNTQAMRSTHTQLEHAKRRRTVRHDALSSAQFGLCTSKHSLFLPSN